MPTESTHSSASARMGARRSATEAGLHKLPPSTLARDLCDHCGRQGQASENECTLTTNPLVLLIMAPCTALLLLLAVLSMLQLGSANLAIIPFSDNACTVPNPSLPSYVSASPVATGTCIPYTQGNPWSSQAPLWLYINCNNYTVGASLEEYYYSINGSCPLLYGGTDVYPANISVYALGWPNRCSTLYYTFSNASGSSIATAYSTVNCSLTNAQRSAASPQRALSWPWAVSVAFLAAIIIHI